MNEFVVDTLLLKHYSSQKPVTKEGIFKLLSVLTLIHPSCVDQRFKEKNVYSVNCNTRKKKQKMKDPNDTRVDEELYHKFDSRNKLIDTLTTKCKRSRSRRDRD